MIPMTMGRAVRHQFAFARRRQGSKRQVIRLWVPIFLVWLLLAPIALLLSPLLIVVWGAGRRDVLRITGALIGLLAGLGGTRIEVDSPDALVFIRVL